MLTFLFVFLKIFFRLAGGAYFFPLNGYSESRFGEKAVWIPSQMIKDYFRCAVHTLSVVSVKSASGKYFHFKGQPGGQ